MTDPTVNEDSGLRAKLTELAKESVWSAEFTVSIDDAGLDKLMELFATTLHTRLAEIEGRFKDEQRRTIGTTPATAMFSVNDIATALQDLEGRK